MSCRSTTDIAEGAFCTERPKMMKLSSFWKDNALRNLFAWRTKERYRPEKHYMRGPGPKAMTKLASGAKPDTLPEQPSGTQPQRHTSKAAS